MIKCVCFIIWALSIQKFQFDILKIYCRKWTDIFIKPELSEENSACLPFNKTFLEILVASDKLLDMLCYDNHKTILLESLESTIVVNLVS